MSKQKTPLAELIENIDESILQNSYYNESPRLKQEARMVRLMATELLAKEREAIINAYETGDKYKFETPGEKWFEEKFEQ